MENMGTWDRETVISELIQGREFAGQLQRALNPSAASREACVFLLESVLSSYDNALALVNCMGLLGNGEQTSKVSAFNMLATPVSLEGNQSDLDSNVPVSKKRKIQPKSSEQVRVCSGKGVEDDGYNWRKYGQKDILGASHPRAYYRCTHRHTQGCLATKQVQRTDENLSFFDVIYRGKHTCIQETIKQIDVQKKEEKSTIPNLEVETQGNYYKEDHFLDFSFSYNPVACENMGTQFFPEPRNFVETSYSTPFLSPATSESYFSLSPPQRHDFGIGCSLLSSESDFTEIISNPAPKEDFPPEDLDFLIDLVDFNSPFLDACDHF